MEAGPDRQSNDPAGAPRRRQALDSDNSGRCRALFQRSGPARVLGDSGAPLWDIAIDGVRQLHHAAQKGAEVARCGAGFLAPDEGRPQDIDVGVL